MSGLTRDGERGFVLSLVIFAVAALSIAGTALFLVVQSESAMAESGAESAAAFHLANAGLARYMGETFGEPAAERTWEMGGGTVTVTASPVMNVGDTAAIYLIESEAQIRDRRVRNLVARRSVQQFASLRLRPFNPTAAVVIAGSRTRTSNVTIDGSDQCAAGRDPLAGVGTLSGPSNLQGSIAGTPRTIATSYSSLMRTIGLDWAALTDPAFAFDYEDAWPPFLLGTVPADEFPTIRVDGDFTAFPWHSGRGLLVVTGEIDFYTGFHWEGVIIAGSMGQVRSFVGPRFSVNGALMTGFEGEGSRWELSDASIRYNSCNVLDAAEGISMFSPMTNTWWESAD